MTKIVPNDLLNPTEKTIKNWNCSFIAVEGPNVLDKLSLEDLEIPYESQYRSRIVLKAGETNQPLIYGAIGKAVTFLMVKVTYDTENDPYYKYSQEEYNITYHFENDPTLRPLGRLMILTGSVDDKIPQIYLNNDIDYDVVIDILHATLDSEYDDDEDNDPNTNIVLTSNLVPEPSGITYNGVISSFTFGEEIEIGDVLYVSGDTKLYKANALQTETLPAMYMALETGVANSTHQVMVSGFISNDYWDFNINEFLYSSLSNGIMTQDLDDLNVGDFVQVLANPIKNNTIHFNPSYNIFQKQ